MISENDEDIKFDECGILQMSTQSKSTNIDDHVFLSTPDVSPTLSESDRMYKRKQRIL